MDSLPLQQKINELTFELEKMKYVLYLFSLLQFHQKRKLVKTLEIEVKEKEEQLQMFKTSGIVPTQNVGSNASAPATGIDYSNRNNNDKNSGSK
jgi:hypothetical protein